ncbi:TonB family protein [Acidithiobacillus sp. 'AMD consortium']|uniref:TonB C-terminal domain-containing protein n=3 Tax=Acidithiobacillus ferridurans TaxID=1232575 RepID=A0A2Z6INZ8_ACIFI|nr:MULTISPECIES: TonB family protein [Acidithiobacillus]MBU2715775.1 TonB family protein [Acidithiobacillus ferridurans]MBU2728289.1 TonB family protein [Acidithiobacillus ferridurans]MBU2732880.1 TonB family protein [Acidithiobacillus ferridurans]MBU2804304.1 TonB family protein [Acidithiobacillus ferridurans]QFG78668.1 TonB family protein [Acidithiobacillus sp. 'AMD consortium']
MAIAEHKFYFLVPEEKPHWSESLPPWLLLSALLIALGIFFLVHVQKPKMVSLRSQTTVHKTFEIMPKPIRPQAPSPTMPRALAPSKPFATPHRIVPAARPQPKPRAVPQPRRAPTPAHRLSQRVAPEMTQEASPSTQIQPLPHISIGRLEEQMDQVARAATASPPLPKFENPKGPVADFYIAGWIQKLERIGDLNYPGEMVGQLKVKVVLNPQGDLQRIIMVQSSGNKALDAAAERIIRLSFPYTPFSKQLAEQTRKIEIPLNMHFLGVRHVSAWH